jgi:hypothetical protein
VKNKKTEIQTKMNAHRAFVIVVIGLPASDLQSIEILPNTGGTASQINYTLAST